MGYRRRHRRSRYGDFDFAGSLAKFDKKTVFTQIQAEDSVRMRTDWWRTTGCQSPSQGQRVGRTSLYRKCPRRSTGTKDAAWKSEAGDTDLDERSSHRDAGNGELLAERKQAGSESKTYISRRRLHFGCPFYSFNTSKLSLAATTIIQCSPSPRYNVANFCTTAGLLPGAI